MGLRVLDISSYQESLDLSSADTDGVIIKATEGTGYVNPVCDYHMTQAINRGIPRGVYHFARNRSNSSELEAQYFIDNIAGYLSDDMCILALDWEDGNGVWDVAWAKRWLDYVYEKTGKRPLIYMSESVVNAYDWSSVAKDYGLWVAKYADYVEDNWYSDRLVEPIVNHWADIAMWQWTSSGRIPTYSGNLDMNEFYGDINAWKAYAKDLRVKPEPVVVTVPPNPVEVKPEPVELTPIPKPEIKPTEDKIEIINKINQPDSFDDVVAELNKNEMFADSAKSGLKMVFRLGGQYGLAKVVVYGMYEIAIKPTGLIMSAERMALITTIAWLCLIAYNQIGYKLKDSKVFKKFFF